MAPGDTVELGYVLPDMLVLDVIRDMAQQHGLIVDTDDYTQTVTLERFELMPFRPAVDWSGKVSLLDVHDVLFDELANGYFRVNIWKYRDSDEDDTELYAYDQENPDPLGQGEFYIDTDWADEEGVIYTSSFKATRMHSPWLGGSRLYVPEIRRFNADGEAAFDPGARVLYVLPNVDIDDISLGTISQIEFEGVLRENIAYGFFYLINSGSGIDNIEDSMSYGTVAGIQSNQRGLLATNYSQLERILNQGRVYRVAMLLSEYEFLNLDFSQPVYLDVGLAKGLFFVDEVTGYEGSNVPCEVTLIQIS